MLARAISAGVYGIEAQKIEIEVDILKGLPNFSIIGLPDSTIRESRDRIRSAIEGAGFEFPSKNFLVNLAPAWFRKQGASFDLPIAIGILRATGQIAGDIESVPLIGELSLDGGVKPAKGVISMVITLLRAGYQRVIVPRENCSEAAAIDGMEVFPVATIAEALQVYTGAAQAFSGDASSRGRCSFGDFSEVRGQETAKRAIEIAGAGYHNILLYGPPGSGKTMLAKRIPSILPELDRDEAITTTMIHSVAGLLRPGEGLVTAPPFRTPHHTTSDAAIVGGGRVPSVGEVSLAHHGILFMDEFVEFKNNVLQSLRQPLEDARITVARALGSFTFPADFLLVASSNPCQCGYLFDPDIPCQCDPVRVKKYFAKIAGPVLDRIDIEVLVGRVACKDLLEKNEAEDSGSIRERVLAARELQKRRFQDSSTKYNARMNNAQIKRFCAIDAETESVITAAVGRLHLSARSFFRILKVSRTIADLDGKMNIEKRHVLEALSYKNLQRTYEL